MGDTEVDVVVVGAGFAGLYLAYRATRMGMSVVVLEAAGGVGGTWYWNRYPGARCDVESIDYSYSFSEELQQEWTWTERFATQPEILRYLNHVADRFDLRRHVQLDTRVVSAHFDEGADTWTVTTESSAGETGGGTDGTGIGADSGTGSRAGGTGRGTAGAGDTITASFVVMATGGLSAPKTPDFPGLETFRGDWYHTARWPSDGVDLSGKRVAIVGTGSTGVQAIPKIAAEAEHLVVLQRTPNFSVPARNRPLADGELDAVKQRYAEHRAAAKVAPSGIPASWTPTPATDVPVEERRARWEAGWEYGGAPVLLRSYSDVITDEEVNDSIADFVRDKIAETVHDPETARKLTPHDHPLGTKRICVDTEYFETYNRRNVELVDIRADPIEEITPAGVRTGDTVHEVDVIVFAIGFDAISGAVREINVRGRDGRTMEQAWADGAKATLGLTVAGFPNLFLVNGPGSPSVLGNVVVFIEQHVDWITDCVDHMRRNGIGTIESTDESDENWSRRVHDIAQGTLYPKAASWYMGANVPGKPRRFLPYAGGLHTYRERCDQAAAAGYTEDFVLTTAERSRPGAPARTAAR